MLLRRLELRGERVCACLSYVQSAEIHTDFFYLIFFLKVWMKRMYPSAFYLSMR